jgi:hypothetical protein
LTAAYYAYYTPPGTPAQSLAQALAAFKVTFLECASLASIGLAVANKFELTIARRDHFESGIFISAKVESPTAMAIEKYIIQNAPEESRSFLRISNDLLYPSWSFRADTSTFISPARMLGLGIPQLPTGRMLGTYPQLSLALKLSGIKVPSIHPPSLNAPKLDLSLRSPF